MGISVIYFVNHRTNKRVIGKWKVIKSLGWEATIEDNQKRGRTRMATVYGFCTEIGSVYTHDIIAVRNSDSGIWETVEHTPQQKKLRSDVKKFFA